MSCPCQQLENLPFSYKGNTFEAYLFDLSSDAQTYGTTVDTAKFTVNDISGVPVLDVTDGSGVTITDATTWQITIDQIDTITFDAGYYWHGLEIKDSAGVTRTVRVGTWQIIEDAPQP